MMIGFPYFYRKSHLKATSSLDDCEKFHRTAQRLPTAVALRFYEASATKVALSEQNVYPRAVAT